MKPGGLRVDTLLRVSTSCWVDNTRVAQRKLRTQLQHVWTSALVRKHHSADRHYYCSCPNVDVVDSIRWFREYTVHGESLPNKVSLLWEICSSKAKVSKSCSASDTLNTCLFVWSFLIQEISSEFLFFCTFVFPTSLLLVQIYCQKCVFSLFKWHGWNGNSINVCFLNDGYVFMWNTLVGYVVCLRHSIRAGTLHQRWYTPSEMVHSVRDDTLCQRRYTLSEPIHSSLV